ncbi:GntR family transcriptional regulator [Pseudorhodoplanes sinuspersici]|uniref:Transcriptional regulator n=1 Tax=Pseudorhodoplanes sinuspersici TaxID=1235591 RepID=A0A1W6ZZM4_9HYPH|nr:transcriptional regulator [Pseudorhodoplanes sinuspersici]
MIPLSVAPNLIQQVYDRILESIVDHTLAPGHRIRQHELAEQLGVSRQPVSHALHLLHKQGLVVESGRKGFQVSPLDPAHIRQLYEVRSALDGLAARLSAARVSVDAAGRSALEAALAAGDAIDERTPLAELIAPDAAFHQALYRLSGNPAIEEMAAPQWPHMRRSMAAVLTIADYRARAWAEHKTIAERVLAGDAAGADAAAQKHALTAGQTTEDRLRSLQKVA